MAETPSSKTVSTKLQRIAELAKAMPQVALTSLSQRIDVEWLHEACKRTRKDAAVGVDGQTWREYEAKLEENLHSLLDRAKSGAYRAPPVRRVHIPKGSGTETRPIGIPTLEDKLLQRAVAMVLEAVYEQDFLPCSFGFRPGRSAHDALEALWKSAMTMHGGWLIEVDIRRFFDTLDHAHLRRILGQRVRDGVLMRLIGKWLNAGVLEQGSVSYPELGTPQGGVISPLLANVYLHDVLDKWIAERVAPCLQGPVQLIRYADDFVLLFRSEHDARRVFAALPKRFAEHGLTLHPDKTRLIEFKQPNVWDLTKPKVSFDFLGFTHYWGRAQKPYWVLKRETANDRFSRGLLRVKQWCQKHRHLSLPEQHRVLSAKLRGHYAYYGLTGNFRRLHRFRDEVRRLWRKWLDRRSYHTNMSWERFQRLEIRYPLPRATVVHSVLPRAANT
jgi:group II intron reverse transcriptase/maturase